MYAHTNDYNRINSTISKLKIMTVTGGFFNPSYRARKVFNLLVQPRTFEALLEAFHEGAPVTRFLFHASHFPGHY